MSKKRKKSKKITVQDLFDMTYDAPERGCINKLYVDPFNHIHVCINRHWYYITSDTLSSLIRNIPFAFKRVKKRTRTWIEE